MAGKSIVSTPGFDLQSLYDQARFLMGIYANLADGLGCHPSVCTHLETRHEPVDEGTVLCRGCGRTVPVALLPDAED